MSKKCIAIGSVLLLAAITAACSGRDLADEQQANIQAAAGQDSGDHVLTPERRAELAEERGAKLPVTEGQAAIPKPFQGRWAIERADCERETGLTRIDVRPDKVQFYEAVARPTSFLDGGARSIQLDMAVEAEGETATRIDTLSLTANGGILTYQRADDAFDYVRCGTDRP